MEFVHRYLPRLLFWAAVATLISVLGVALLPAPLPPLPKGATSAPTRLPAVGYVASAGRNPDVNLSEVQRLLTLETALATSSVSLNALPAHSAAADALRATWQTTYDSLAAEGRILQDKARRAVNVARASAIATYVTALGMGPDNGLAGGLFGSGQVASDREVYSNVASGIAASRALAASSLAERVSYATSQLSQPSTGPAPVGGSEDLLNIMGPSTLSASDLAQWYQSIGYYDATTMTPTQIAQIYIEEGNALGVRGDVAFAQAVLESGGFAMNGGGNNFAGMGACGASCGAGYSFASVRQGIRAQLELLKNYADAHYVSRDMKWVNLSSIHGRVTTWIGLGGTWSTDPVYGSHVLGIYLSILTWALSHSQSSTTTSATSAVAHP